VWRAWACGGNPVLAVELTGLEYTGVLDHKRGAMMSNDTKKDDGSPKFGRLLLVLVAAVVFCGLLTWVMGTYFPNFPG
jgi:hypothetical protein